MVSENVHVKVVLVVGATGQQGGSVVHALLESGGFEVRAFTRDTASPKVRANAAYTYGIMG